MLGDTYVTEKVVNECLLRDTSGCSGIQQLREELSRATEFTSGAKARTHFQWLTARVKLVPFPSIGVNRGCYASLAPAALLTIGRGNYRGCRVRFCCVVIDRGRGLGAEIAALGVEVQRADAVCTLRAGELHAALDALNSVGFHWVDCSPSAGGS